MKDGRNIDLYKRLYLDMNFDRSGLFKAMKNEFDCNTVIYPGCSYHITPSLYFQHVVYIDISEAAKAFFENIQDILRFVSSNKEYKQSPYVQFLCKDYTTCLPIRENNYDLLIALFAGGITQSCKRYVKPGGHILTNNHHNDAKEVLSDPSIVLVSLIIRKGKQYQVVRGTNEMLTNTLKNYRIPNKNMRKSDKGMEYVDRECYFVLKKLK